MIDWGDSEWDYVAEYIRWEENENGEDKYYLAGEYDEEYIMEQILPSKQFIFSRKSTNSEIICLIGSLIELFGFDFSNYYQDLKPYIDDCRNEFLLQAKSDPYFWKLEELDEVEERIVLGKKHPDYKVEYPREIHPEIKKRKMEIIREQKENIARAKKHTENLQEQNKAREVIIGYMNDILIFEEIRDVAKETHITKIFRKLNEEIQNKIDEKSDLTDAEKVWNDIKRSNKIEAFKKECKIIYLRNTAMGFTFTHKNSQK